MCCFSHAHTCWKFAIGLCLFVIALLGDLTPLGNYENTEPRDWERFSIETARLINSSDDFLLEAINRNPDFIELSEKERGCPFTQSCL